MLVLSRKAGEELVIGDNIVVRINRIRGNTISISIDAPIEISIRRGELRAKPAEPGIDPPAKSGTAPGGD